MRSNQNADKFAEDSADGYTQSAMRAKEVGKDDMFRFGEDELPAVTEDSGKPSISKR